MQKVKVSVDKILLKKSFLMVGEPGFAFAAPPFEKVLALVESSPAFTKSDHLF